MAGNVQKWFVSGKKSLWFKIFWGLGLATVLALPDVDSSMGYYHEMKTLRTKLAGRNELPQRARTLAARIDQSKGDMAGLESALVPAEAFAALQRDLTQMARKAGCRLRSVRPGTSGRRPLGELLGKPGRGGSRPGKPAAWEVEEHGLSASIRGPLTNLLTFLAKLDNDVRILTLDSLNLHPPPDSSDELLLDIRIKSVNLVRGDSS